MKRLLIILSMITLSMIARPAQAGDGSLYTIAGGWMVGRAESECFMGAEFQNKSSLIINYNDRLGRATVIFTDPSVKSLKTGDERKLNTYFLKNSSDFLDDGWADKTFTVVETTSGARSFSRHMSAEFLTDMARYDQLAFFYDKVLLKSFNLAGSALGIKALRECAEAAARANPSDPFEGE